MKARAIVGILSGLIAAGVVAGAGNAAADPVVTSFPLSSTGFTGDPWPISTETVTATTGQVPGRTVFDVTPMCNAFNPSLCMSAHVMDVHWVNLSTGAAGTTPVGPFHTMIYPPGVFTGAGQIVATVTWSDGASTLVPGFETFAAT
ncbi:hypothetical protein [Antrihabitans cavernicola]|uniref:Uncharacterized protein n=1 Tax=Antrihabitans cavernicola TaxID=2495913 RepID=A0A5A7S6L9_9NOCA|nr:hypothetical protein [Spelaeibacter cavernicola]KAA0021526.1 hypothetical protein FOY51_18420 [Spelaeibacter cavernicola]